MADHDHASETGRAHDNDAPRRAAAPAKEAGATSAGAGTAPARAAAPDATRSPDAASLGARQVKAKMVAGAASDPAEREADRTADQVMRMAAPEQNRPPAVDPTVADASSRGPGRATSVPPGPQRQAATAAPSPPIKKAAETTAGTPPGPAAGTAPGPVRRQAVADHDPHGAKEVPEETQRYLDRSQGTGSPLPDGSRRYFEARFSTDFGGVGVHDDDAADQAARSIGALAFTRGNDIWFSAGAYDPSTDGGRRLLAHELAHIAQQYPGIGRQAAPGLGGAVIRRAAGPKPPAGTKTSWTNPKNPKESIDTAGPTLVLDKLAVPRFKAGHRPKTIKWRTVAEERKNTQRSLWRDDTKNKGAAIEGVRERLKDIAPGEKGPYRLESKGQEKSGAFYMGQPEDVGPQLVIPPWDRNGNWAEWQVDHMAEWQIGGEDEDVTNYQLLNPQVNNKSGEIIKKNIRASIQKFLDAANIELAERQTPDKVKGAKWSVTWSELEPVDGYDPKDEQIFKREEINTKAFMKGLEKLEEGRVKDLEGTRERLAVYPSKAGGQVAHPEHKKGLEYEYRSRVGRSRITKITWLKDQPNLVETGPVGQASVDILGKKEKGKIDVWRKNALDIPILGIPKTVPWGGFLDREAIKAERARLLDLAPFSPVTFDELDFDLDKGLNGRGAVPKPDVKLLERASIAVILEAGEVGLEATIAGEELQLPGPFKVQGGSLTLAATTGELSVTGQVDFEIQKVATGFVRARKGTSSGFAVDAELQFDKKMFDGDAKIKGSYEDGKWAVEGTLGVGPNKIKGIKKASATVKVSEGTITADGEFETSLKGVDKGKLSFKYNEATGMEIAGEIILGKGIPGIKSGKLDATIKEGPTGHSLSGDVTLEPSVPGLTGTVTGKYEDGAFLVEADLGYEKGLAKGSVKIGLTNQAPGPDGKPAGPPKPDGSLTVYGGGTVTLTLTPWLQGTVGLKLTERGEIEVSGEVALPSAFEVFKERTIEKQLLSIGIDIPIIGVAVAGQRIGIFATIRGGVSISAGFGPGELRDVALKVTYNPARPDDTTVSGRGTFVVPAHAGLRLSVDGGLGAGIPIVSATAGITVYGEIGVAGAASAGVAITWTPRSGIVLDAKGEIFVEPKFKFGVEAFVDVSADLWVTTIELYHHKWKLADFEYGSNLRFGLSLPIHYESGKPFDISFDQIQWTYPHIEPSELLGGLMKQLVG
jgi:Domain of unknown function (DUF4157)